MNLLPSDYTINGLYRKYAFLFVLYSYQHLPVQTRIELLGLVTYKRYLKMCIIVNKSKQIALHDINWFTFVQLRKYIHERSCRTGCLIILINILMELYLNSAYLWPLWFFIYLPSYYNKNYNILFGAFFIILSLKEKILKKRNTG